jgi:hypothetical protein
MQDVFSAPCAVAGKGAVPCFNEIYGNTFCKVGKYIDADAKTTASWSSTVENNTEVPCKYTSEPPALHGARAEPYP